MVPVLHASAKNVADSSRQRFIPSKFEMTNHGLLVPVIFPFNQFILILLIADKICIFWVTSSFLYGDDGPSAAMKGSQLGFLAVVPIR